MALETLKGLKKIDGFDLVIMDELKERYPEKFPKEAGGQMDYKWFEKYIRPNNFIYVRHDVNSISFTIQNGPVKENGVNGCQIDTIAATVIEILKGLNANVPCRENAIAMTKFQEGLMWLKKRKEDREARGVEGENKD